MSDGLPPPDEPIGLDAYDARWPMAAEKCEYYDDGPVWSGRFDGRDLVIARRAFPGRRVELRDGGSSLWVGPASGGYG